MGNPPQVYFMLVTEFCAGYMVVTQLIELHPQLAELQFWIVVKILTTDNSFTH